MRTKSAPEPQAMGLLYSGWWRALTDLRPLVRFLAERFPKGAPFAIRLRSIAHLLVGNPVQAGAGFGGLALSILADISFRWLTLGFGVVCIMVEIFHRVRYKDGSSLVCWREAWRVRRRWPSDWAVVSAKTAQVQAEVGSSKEPVASAVLRPVADHPKLSWFPRMDWPVVSWWVGPPPGRSLAALDDLTDVLAANISQVSDVAVEYERENDSFGRLIVSFEDVLAKPSQARWATAQSAPVEVEQLDDFDSAVDAFDPKPAAPSRLRLVDGEA